MRYRSFAFWIFPLLVGFLASYGCSEKRDTYSPSAAPLTGDPGQENCGFDLGEEVPDGPIIDPCGPDAQFLHGPVSMTPEPSSPAQDRVELDIPEAGFICVTLTIDRIASATVTLNGKLLFAQNDFNARVEQLNRIAAVEEGDAFLEFEVRATKHGSFTYEVRYIPLDPVPRGEVSGNNNRLSVYNLRDHPDPFSPEKQDGIRDTVTMSVTASVDRDGISPQSSNKYVVYGTFEIASPISCQEIARLTTQLTLAEATPTSTDRNYVVPLTVVWDGRDNSGAFVDGGTYFYRAVAELVKTTPPGSSRLLDIAYSEILTATNDDVPPEIVLSPADGEQVATDMPMLEVAYSDDASGVDNSTLSVLLNGKDITARFDASDTQATVQVDIDWYLEEGANILSAAVSDNAGNRGSAVSIFTVHTPTDVLIDGLDSTDRRYHQRSAYKLVCRLDELNVEVLRRCLKLLNDNREPRAADCVLDVLQSDVTDLFVITLAAGAIGEAFNLETVSEEAIEELKRLLFEHPSYYVKIAATRSLGLVVGPTNKELALSHLEDYLDHGPTYPEKPDCDADPIGCLHYDQANESFGEQVGRAITRLMGPDVSNPVDLEQVRETAIEAMQRYLLWLTEVMSQGSAP